MKQKICTECSEIKDMTEFHRNKHNSDGRAGRCKACLKEYYQANKERDLANSRKYYREHGKELRKLPKNEKQFSPNEETYQKEHEKFFNEEFYFIKRDAWRGRVYDPIARAKYYEEHKAEIANGKRCFYDRNRDEILELAKIKRAQRSKKKVAADNKKRSVQQKLKRDSMTDEQYEAVSAAQRERYRLNKGSNVRPYRRNKRRKL